MVKNTASRARRNEKRESLFKDKEHKNFYSSCLSKCRCQDFYHQALIYCLGMSEDTRRNIKQIYDFDSGSVKPKCLQEGWQTSGSRKIVRIAFNLYCDGTPSTYDYKDVDEQIRETRLYSVSDLFCTEDAPYFWQAIKFRYPEYCHNDKLEDSI